MRELWIVLHGLLGTFQGSDLGDALHPDVSCQGDPALGEACDFLAVCSQQSVRDGLFRVEDDGEFPGDPGPLGMLLVKGMAEGVGPVETIH